MRRRIDSIVTFVHVVLFFIAWAIAWYTSPVWAISFGLLLWGIGMVAIFAGEDAKDHYE